MMHLLKIFAVCFFLNAVIKLKKTFSLENPSQKYCLNLKLSYFLRMFVAISEKLVK